MRVCVFGTGGVGGYFGGRLAQAGQDVVFIARGAHLQAIRTHGLRVDSVNGDFRIAQAQACENPDDVGVVDFVLIGVKAWQVPETAEAIRPTIGPNTCVIPLQNGVEAPEQLSKVLGGQHVAGGLCGIVSFIEGPGHIRHTAADPYIKFGELDRRPSPRLESLRQAFAQVRVNAEIPNDIHAAMWMKYLAITPCSSLGALTRAPIGTWRSLPETRRMAEQAVKEVESVARARGIALPPDAFAISMAHIDRVAPEATVSMQRDIIAGRPSELDAQIGAVVRLGIAAGVPTPLHSFVYGSLLPLEMRARGVLSF